MDRVESNEGDAPSLVNVIEDDSLVGEVRFPGIALADLDGDGALELVVVAASLTQADTVDLLVCPAEAKLGDMDAMDQWLETGASQALVVNPVLSGDWDGDGRDDMLSLGRDWTLSSHLGFTLAFSTGTYFGGRDPLAAEIWFAAMDAMIRGSLGGVFFRDLNLITEQDRVWQDVQAVAGRLSSLLPIVAGQTLDRGTSDGFAWWWVQTEGRAHLLVAHESRGQASFDGIALPEGVTGQTVLTWDEVSRLFVEIADAMLGPGGFLDERPFGPFEVRVYQILP